MFGSVSAEQAQVDPAIRRIVKDVLLRIASLRDVVWNSRCYYTRHSGHSEGEWRIGPESLDENRGMSILSPDFERGDRVHFGRPQRRQTTRHHAQSD